MSLKYLLDTNMCIYIAKQKPLSVLQKFELLTVGQIVMSIITYGELLYGAQKSHNPKKSKEILENFIHLVSCLPMSTEAGRFYGEIRSHLEKLGKPISNNDLWIAAHALGLNIILITNNLKEFSSIKGLKAENWVE